jgi:glycosyltransferase involved in cell wall biosynthesis
LRVGLIIYGNLEILTGGFLYDRLLVEHLRAQGDEVEVIAIPWRTYGPHLTDNFSSSLSERLRAARLDVLIQDELCHPSLFLFNRRLKKQAQYPIVTLVHLLRCSEPRPPWLNRLYGAIEKRYLKTVDGVIYNCETTRATVDHLMKEKPASVVAHPGRDHLHRGLSAQEITERAQRPGPLQIISVANVVRNKGLSLLIEALARMPAGSWHLTVAGSLEMEPGYVSAVRKQIAQAGLSEQVSLVGTVPNEEMPVYLAKSQLLVVPSYYEAFAIAYLEAMSFGLPVIASTAGGARELITHGTEGFLLKPGDADGLAQYLRAIILDRERLLHMSLAAHSRIGSHPTWAESFGRIRTFLHSLVKSRETADGREMKSYIRGEAPAPLSEAE